MAFDPYHKWLGIPPDEQPPNHYRLLGIVDFEDDDDIIDGAASQRVLYLRTIAAGEHEETAAALLNEVAAARIILLNPESRSEYNLSLPTQTSSSPNGVNTPATQLPTQRIAPPQSNPPRIPAPSKSNFPLGKSTAPHSNNEFVRERPHTTTSRNKYSQGLRRQATKRPNHAMTIGLGVAALLVIVVFIFAISQQSQNEPPTRTTQVQRKSTAPNRPTSKPTEKSKISTPSNSAINSSETTQNAESTMNEIDVDTNAVKSPQKMESTSETDTHSKVDVQEPVSPPKSPAKPFLGDLLTDSSNEETQSQHGLTGIYSYTDALDLGEHGAVTAVAFGPDNIAAFGSRNGTTTITIVKDGKPTAIHQITTPENPKKLGISALDFGTTPNLLLICRTDVVFAYDIRLEDGIWNVRLLNKLDDPSTKINSASWATFLEYPDEPYIVTATNSGFLRVWDYVSGKFTNTMKVHNEGSTAISYNPSNGYALSAGRRGNLYRWEFDGKSSLGPKLRPSETGNKGVDHSGSVTSLNWSENGMRVVSSASRQIKVWSTDNDLNAIIAEFTLTNLGDTVRDCDISPDGRFVIACSTNQALLWDLQNDNQDSTPLIQDDGPIGKLLKIEFNEDGRTIAAASIEGRIQFWQHDDVTDSGALPNLQSASCEAAPRGSSTSNEVTTLPDALIAGRTALYKKQFIAAARFANTALNLADTPIEKAMAKRLHDVSEYAGKFHALLNESLGKAKVNSMVTIGQSTVAEVVFIGRGMVTLRINGVNKSWQQTELPVEISMAFANRYFEDAPMTPVLKGAFLISRSNPLPNHIADAIKLFKIAGSDFRGLASFVDDDYDDITKKTTDSVE